MSFGESLIWITFILLAIWGVRLITRNKKWRLVGKIVAVLVLIGILVGVGAWVWNWNRNRPYVASTLGKVSLGMSPLDVTLALGKPSVDSKDQEEIDSDRRFVYNDYSGDLDYFIRFTGKDDTSAKVNLICSEDLYQDIFGLGKYDTEKQVIGKLGNPTSISIKSDGLSKMISYEQWKVAFSIEKGEVRTICVTESGEVRYLEEYGETAN